MMAMRYGALPIVHETGGLRDSVHAYNAETGAGDGFWFLGLQRRRAHKHSAHGEGVYADQPKVYAKLQQHAMVKDFDWHHSAAEYLKRLSNAFWAKHEGDNSGSCRDQSEGGRGVDASNRLARVTPIRPRFVYQNEFRLVLESPLSGAHEKRLVTGTQDSSLLRSIRVGWLTGHIPTLCPVMSVFVRHFRVNDRLLRQVKGQVNISNLVIRRTDNRDGIWLVAVGVINQPLASL